MTSALYNVNVSREALLYNIEVLTKNTDFFSAVVKADAYGHGLIETAETCLSSRSVDKLYAFIVGCTDEGIVLRSAKLSDKPILSLFGIIPQQEEEIVKAKEADLTLVVHNKEGLQIALENNISFALKWNTGMNRFGFGLDEIAPVLDYIKTKKDARFELNLSHLATAEEQSDFEEGFVTHQWENFDTIQTEILKEFPHSKFSLGQSAHILNRSYKKDNVVRLGVAMYGVNPFFGTELEEKGSHLEPAMTVCAPILAINNLKKGQSIGYGQKISLKRDSEIALLGIGYADGYRRQYIGSTGNEDESKNTTIYTCYKGTRAPLIGNVCMQVSFIDVTGLNAKLGDRVYLLGGCGKKAIRAEELGAWWGTLSYEPLCAFGKIAEKTYN